LGLSRCKRIKGLTMEAKSIMENSSIEKYLEIVQNNRRHAGMAGENWSGEMAKFLKGKKNRLSLIQE
jgi:hypothetical protein